MGDTALMRIWRWTGLRRVRKLALPDLCPVCLAASAAEARQLCATCTGRLRELPEPRCSGCGGVNDGVMDLCGECLHGARRPWEVAVSGFEFGGEIREIIHRFKYQGHVCLAPFLAESMCLNWARFGTGLPDVVVPVPMHRWKELWRGYNQAELLARQISQRMNLPLCRGLRRTGRQRQQAQLRVEERQENVRNAFRATATGRLADRHALLVDDVFTTGATLTAATVALRAAGVRQVSVLTVAKG